MLIRGPAVYTLKSLHRLIAPVACSKTLVSFSTSVEGQPPEGTTSPPRQPLVDPSNLAGRMSQDSASSSDTSSSESSSSDGDSSGDSSASDAGNAQNFSKSRNGTRSTYIEEEVAKFRAMADSWWDLQGDCKPLHSLNKLRVSMIREGLVQTGIAEPACVDGPRPLTGLTILDVGCGGGILCEPLARLGAKVVGLDAAEENTSVAQLHAQQDSRVYPNVEYVCGTVEEHAEHCGTQYDAVVASEVLEHVDATDQFIDTCAQTLKPGGSLFLTTINKTVCSWVGAIAVAEYMLHLLPPGTHDYNKFVPRQDLLLMLEKSGFVTRLIHGMAYNPIINEWFWLSNTSVNYAIHAVKRSNGR